MNPQGYLSLVLHAHLPWVRHPEHAEFLEESWLFEAITESYLPLLTVFDGLLRDDVDFRVTMGITPTLLAMLQDDLLRARYERHLDRLVDLAAREERRLHRHVAYGPTARFLRARFESLRDSYRSLDGDLVGAFAKLQKSGRVELLASAATHAYLPHLRDIPSALRAQVAVGVDSYRRAFGRDPAGFWLPECAYFPGLDRTLAEFGLRYFFLESHGVFRATPTPRHGVLAPVVCGSGLAAFGRDPESSRLVWSAEVGYPGDAEYLDFHKDIGFDLPESLLGAVLGPDRVRSPIGLKYHRVTGRTRAKRPYRRDLALARSSAHAEDFVSRLERRARQAVGHMDRRPIFVAPYDAELFGHWWFEGPEWLDRVLRRVAAARGAQLLTATPSEYLAEYPFADGATPAESSWGHGGFHEVWLHGSNEDACQESLTIAREAERLVREAQPRNALGERALQGCLRQALLTQSSDWAFLRRLGTASEYARQRFEEHVGRFHSLRTALENSLADDDSAEHALESQTRAIEEKDPIFPDLDARYFIPEVGVRPPQAGAGRRHVAFVTAEMAPLAKVGGLGDVCGALPEALAQSGARVTVVLPAYRGIDRRKHAVRRVGDVLQVAFEGSLRSFRLLRARSPRRGVDVYLIDVPELFDRDGIYSDPATGSEYPDNGRRFLFFAKASLEVLRSLGRPVDVLHAHDHQTAMAIALKSLEGRSCPVIGEAATVFTLHNLGYPGIYGPEALDVVGIDRSWFYPGSPFEYYGQVNLMKLGIELADKVNAVSETYAREICDDPAIGAGLQGVLRARDGDLVGILNGIDTGEWNPADDPFLPAAYSARDLAGKRECKSQLRERMGLSSRSARSTPLVGMVTRLVDQKGLDLVEQSLDRLMALGIDLVVLGTGLPKYHRLLEDAQERFAGRVGVALEFDNALAHRIEAGADMFLMPSLYEPCGLNQMYSLRYGAVPVVRATGGLADTVIDADHDPDHGVGFAFHDYVPDALVDALRRAVDAYFDEPRWQAIQKRGMERDFSWTASAQKYIELYEQALERRRKPHRKAAVPVV